MSKMCLFRPWPNAYTIGNQKMVKKSHPTKPKLQLHLLSNQIAPASGSHHHWLLEEKIKLYNVQSIHEGVESAVDFLWWYDQSTNANISCDHANDRLTPRQKHSFSVSAVEDDISGSYWISTKPPSRVSEFRSTGPQKPQAVLHNQAIGN